MKTLLMSIFVLMLGLTVKAEEGHDHGDEKETHEEEVFEGVQLSPQAEKNFEIQRVAVGSSQQFEISASAVVTSGTEKNLYRYRDGKYLRVDFEVLKKVGKSLVVKSKDLKPGDEIVISGMGLLRIAELAATGGAPTSHSH